MEKKTVKKKLNMPRGRGITRSRRVNDIKYNDEKQKRQKTKNTLVDITLLESYKLSNANATKNRR